MMDELEFNVHLSLFINIYFDYGGKMKKIPYEDILNKAMEYEKDIVKFLRDMIAIPGESCTEKEVILRVKEEAEKLGYSDIKIDKLGSLIATIGKGKTIIAVDGHIDTVGPGNIDNWTFDPYKGFEDEEKVGGRGTSDQRGGIASAIYSGKIIKDLDLLDDYTFMVTASVMEEDCDGLCWQYMINENVIPRPDFVILSEASDGGIKIGHRGRMEIKVEVDGKTCHASTPYKGDNAIYKMAKIISEIENLSKNMKIDDKILGKGDIVVSQVYFSNPSRNAVPDGCTISIDRRLTIGESADYAMDEVRELKSVKEANAKVSMYTMEEPSYTGLVYKADCNFPTWLLEESHVVCKTMVDTHKNMFGTDKPTRHATNSPLVGKWPFSTNGVAIMGTLGIPCIGYGPGREDQVHIADEVTWKKDLVECAALYAAIPLNYLNIKNQ